MHLTFEFDIIGTYATVCIMYTIITYNTYLWIKKIIKIKEAFYIKKKMCKKKIYVNYILV